MAEPPQRKTPCNPEVEVASSRAQIRLSLPNLAMELRVRPRSCHATAEEHTFSLYSRSCKFQSTKAPSAAKSSNRTPGETLQRNTPFATIVEFASSTVQNQIPLPNMLIEIEVRSLPTRAGTEEYIFRLHSRSCKLQSTWAPSATQSSYGTPDESSPRAVEEHTFCL